MASNPSVKIKRCPDLRPAPSPSYFAIKPDAVFKRTSAGTIGEYQIECSACRRAVFINCEDDWPRRARAVYRAECGNCGWPLDVELEGRPLYVLAHAPEAF